MVNVMTTRMSSKGQVVLPEAVREQFGWSSGTSFTLIVYKGSVIMKPVEIPTEAELDAEYGEALAECRASARRAGFRPSDLTRILDDDRATRLARHARRERRGRSSSIPMS